MLERTVARPLGERPDPDWAYVAENPDGIPVRGAQGAIGLGDRDALLARVRDMLAHVFAPLSSDLHDALEAFGTLPRSRLPLGGSPPVRSPYGPVLARWLKLRPDVAAAPWLLTVARERYGSEQTLDESPHQEGIDLVAPIGEAARAMGGVARTELAARARELTAKHAALLAAWTFQPTALASMLAGISTYAGVAALLTYRVVPGYDAIALLDGVEESLLFDRLAKIPFAILGPMFFYGLPPRRAVEAKGGRLVLARPFDRVVRTTRYVDSPWIIGPGQGRPTHKGCPIALRHLPARGGASTNPETWLATLGRDYLRLARAFYRDEP